MHMSAGQHTFVVERLTLNVCCWVINHALCNRLHVTFSSADNFVCMLFTSVCVDLCM
jgi:hypothetical protein